MLAWLLACGAPPVGIPATEPAATEPTATEPAATESTAPARPGPVLGPAELACRQASDCRAISAGCCGPSNLAANRVAAAAIARANDVRCGERECAHFEQPPVDCVAGRCVIAVRMHPPAALDSESRFRQCAQDAECVAAPTSCCGDEHAPVNALGAASWSAWLHAERTRCASMRCGVAPRGPDPVRCVDGRCAFAP